MPPKPRKKGKDAVKAEDKSEKSDKQEDGAVFQGMLSQLRGFEAMVRSEDFEATLKKFKEDAEKENAGKREVEGNDAVKAEAKKKEKKEKKAEDKSEKSDMEEDKFAAEKEDAGKGDDAVKAEDKSEESDKADFKEMLRAPDFGATLREIQEDAEKEDAGKWEDGGNDAVKAEAKSEKSDKVKDKFEKTDKGDLEKKRDTDMKLTSLVTGQKNNEFTKRHNNWGDYKICDRDVVPIKVSIDAIKDTINDELVLSYYDRLRKASGKHCIPILHYMDFDSRSVIIQRYKWALSDVIENKSCPLFELDKLDPILKGSVVIASESQWRLSDSFKQICKCILRGLHDLVQKMSLCRLLQYRR